MEKRERVRRDRRKKEDSPKGNWREQERRDSDCKDNGDNNRREKGTNKKDNSRREGGRRQDDGPRNSSGKDNFKNRPKSYKPPAPAEKKNIDYTAIPDPHMFDNLKRETDEIAALTTKKYSKRQVFSNWAKYEKPMDVDYYEEDDEKKGADFEVLLQGAQIGGHLKLKSESSWDSRCSALQSEIFSLNLSNLSLGLGSIPFYDKMGLDQHMFTSGEIERMNSQTSLNCAAYDVTKKNHVKPRLKRQEHSKSTSEGELLLYKNNDPVESKTNPCTALTFDIPESEDMMDFGIALSSARDKPYQRPSPEKATVRSHQDSRNSPVSMNKELENKAQNYQNTNGYQSSGRNKATSEDIQLKKSSKEKSSTKGEQECYVSNDSSIVEANSSPFAKNCQQEFAELMPDTRQSAGRESWSSERDETSNRSSTDKERWSLEKKVGSNRSSVDKEHWSVEKDKGNNRSSCERDRDIALPKYSSIEKDLVSNRSSIDREHWSSEKEVSSNRSSAEKDQWSVEKDIASNRSSIDKEQWSIEKGSASTRSSIDKEHWSLEKNLSSNRSSVEKEQWNIEKDIANNRFSIGKENDAEEEIELKKGVDPARLSAEMEIVNQSQGLDEEIVDRSEISRGGIEKQSTNKENDKVSEDREVVVKKRRANRNRGSKGTKRRSGEFSGEEPDPEEDNRTHPSVLEQQVPKTRNTHTSKPEVQQKDLSKPTGKPTTATQEVKADLVRSGQNANPPDDKTEPMQPLVREPKQQEVNRDAKVRIGGVPLRIPGIGKEATKFVQQQAEQKPLEQAPVVKQLSTEKELPTPPKLPTRTRTPKKPGQEDDQLDFLLSLTKPSSDAPVSFVKPSKAVRSKIDDEDEKLKLSNMTQGQTTEDLEDWLDSMLDD